MKKDQIQLLIEAVMLYIVLPLVFYAELIPVPKLTALLLVAGWCLFRLRRDNALNQVAQNFGFAENTHWISITERAIMVGIFILLLIVWIQPDQLLAMPAGRPAVWVSVMLLYPVLSVLPQEFIYRTYFFHRLRNSFPSDKILIFASAFAFSFLHIVYDNWWAIGLSFLAGIMFSITYYRTKSLFWVTVEHTLFGWLIFTLGFGNYFHEGF